MQNESLVINQMVLAYYFPQYYSFKENDMVHGDGFTDWNLFKVTNNNHLLHCKLPLEPPIGLGYYDPTLKDIRIKQASLAKKYAIDGFIYYHYWLENHVVMDEVLNNLVDDNEPDIPFCLCFANESWKHCYNPINGEYNKFHSDGSTYRQLYDNPIDHAFFLQKLFLHKNYIKINNKPILFVYKSDADVYPYLDIISKELKKYNIDDIYIIANTGQYCLSNYSENIIRNPDAYSHFAPHRTFAPDTLSNLPCIYSGYTGWNIKPRHIDSEVVENFDPITITKETYKKLMMMYYDKSSPQIYTIFAWNEWAEGAVLEPNSTYAEDLGFSIKKAKDIMIKILNKDIRFFYGIKDHFKDVTKKVFINCIYYISESWYLFLPKGSFELGKFFGDHVPGVHKVVKMIINENEIIIDEYSDIKIFIL